MLVVQFLGPTSGTVTHTAARDRYGELHQEHVFLSLVPDDGNAITATRTANLLLQLAVNRLRQYAEPQQTIQIAVQAPQQMIRPFHLLQLRVRQAAVDDSFRVASVATTYDQADGLRQSLTLTSQQSVRLVDEVSLLARQLKDLVEAADLGAVPAPAVYVGEVATAFTGNGGGEGVALTFVAGPGDDVGAVLEIERAGAGAYEYAVDDGVWSQMTFAASIDLTADIVASGSHRLHVRLTPGPASRMSARVTVSS